MLSVVTHTVVNKIITSNINKSNYKMLQVMKESTV